jgi:hypothetical protein
MLRVAILVVIALSAQRAQRVAPRELAFNWPVGIEARVQTERSRERIGARAGTAGPVTITQRMRVLAHPDGRLIQFEGLSGLAGLPGAGEAAVAAIAQQVQAIVPSFVVAADGRLVKVEHVDALRAALKKLLAPYRPELDKLPGGFSDLLKQMTSERTLSQLAAQEWDLLVSGWIGLELKAEMFDGKIDAPVPIFPGITIPMNVRAGIVDFTRCTRAGVLRECANIESRQTVDEKGMTIIMSRLAAAALKDPTSVKYDRFDVVTHVRVQLEVDSLLPHELSTVRTTEIAVTEPGRPREELKQVDRRTTRFVC